MNVSLTPELEAMVNERVKSGLYTSASEVIREGLRLIKVQDDLRQIRFGELRRDVALGVDQIEHGSFTTYDSPEALATDIKQEGRRRTVQATKANA